MEWKRNDTEVASKRKVKDGAPKSLAHAIVVGLLLIPLNLYW